MQLSGVLVVITTPRKLPGDEQQISMGSPLVIGELVVEDDESGLVSGKGVDHLLPGLLSRSLRVMKDIRPLPLSR